MTLQMNDSVVPVVDISGWRVATARASIAEEVDAACSNVGFLQIVGHATPQFLIDDMLRAADALFARPLDEKRTWIPPAPEINRGYAPIGTESLSYSLGREAPPDLFEAFNIGLDDVPGTAVYQARAHDLFAANIWPTTLDVSAPIVAYFGAVAELARRLTRIFAVALGLDEDFFVDKTDHSTDTMRMNHYLRRPGEPEPIDGQQRMGAHTDYGIVTVLYADPVAGLEIVAPDGSWRSVVPEPGAFLVNLGDLTAEWTNDRWRSTLHRVVPPTRSQSGPARRRSVAFFHDGNHDALVECLPTCVGVDNPARYPPVLAGDHLMAKLMGPRTQSASQVALDTASSRLAAADGAPAPPT